jgi:hypothetical protein
MRPAGVQPTGIADVRHVPLDQLPAEADCGHMVRMIMRRQAGQSRVDVAMFNSAI